MQIPVVSVLKEGRIDTFEMWSEPKDCGDTEVEIRGSQVDKQVESQLRLAKEIAQKFLKKPYVGIVAENNLDESKIVVQPQKEDSYSGPSFGLAFLAGCLSVGLNVPIAKDHILTAAIDGSVDTSDSPGNKIKLGRIGKLGEKLAISCSDHKTRLYLHGRQEQELIEFERCFWRGNVDRGCWPITLAETVSVAAVVAAGLDSYKLLEKLTQNEKALGFLLLLFKVGPEIKNQGSMIPYLGKAIARYKGQYGISEIESYKNLTKDLAIKPSPSPDKLLLEYAKNWLNASITDDIKLEAIYAVCSFGQEKLFTASDSESSEFGHWLRQINFESVRGFVNGLRLMQECSQVADDFEKYWSSVHKVIVKCFQNIIATISHLANENKFLHAIQLIKGLMAKNVATEIGRLDPQLVKLCRAHIQDLIDRYQKVKESNFNEYLNYLNWRFAFCQFPEIIEWLNKNQQNRLSFVFQLNDARFLSREEKTAHQPRPALQQFNDLALSISAPQGIAVWINSPVLLFESCLRQHFSYCRRREMTRAEDTMSRYPINDVDAVVKLAGPGSKIGFKVPHQDGEYSMPSVRWSLEWPPAIDSQLMAAAMVSNQPKTSAFRLLDVGCGTGYLSLVAAHCWSGLKELHLVDVNRLAIAASEKHIEEDQVAKNLNCNTYWQDFTKFTKSDFDILVCTPPYLPDRQVPMSEIEISTNDTGLLESVVTRGYRLAREIWLGFSILAWPEFQRALSQVSHHYEFVEIVRRDYVPFRIPWLEPISPDDKGSNIQFEDNKKYYQQVLRPRGLVDLDEDSNWPDYLRGYAPIASTVTKQQEIVDSTDEDLLEEVLDNLKQSSRGYRFWQEVRVIRLISK